MRKTNLSHLLAISGLHMAMVTGWMFALSRWILILMPRTRYWPHAKEVAAYTAIGAGLFYLFIAGIPLSAARAYVMVLCIFGAILVRRQAAPMRSLALAALILLIYDPSNLLEPGFQLSFTATLALIATYESLALRYSMREIDYSVFTKTLLFLGGTLLTTFVAELATAPLVAYHFGQASLYGMLANLLVMPIVTFIIMPALVLSFFLLPLSLEAPSFYVMEQGIYAMLFCAQWVSELSGASHRVSGITTPVALTFTAGLLWLCLWQGRVRLFGFLIAMVGGIMILFSPSHPDFLLSHDAKQIAIRLEEDELPSLIRGRNGYFITSQWTEGMGEERLSEVKPNMDTRYRCDGLGCIVTAANNLRIALPYSHAALAKDCHNADIIISSFTVRTKECDLPTIIDRRSLKHSGGIWGWIEKDNIRIENSAQQQGMRPWNRFVR